MLTLQDIRSAHLLRAGLARLEAFASGADQFGDDGWGWPGQLPINGFQSRTEALGALRRLFTPMDVVSDAISAHCDAVAGEELMWSLTVARPLKEDEQPTTAEQALIDEAEAALTSWWDEYGIQGFLRESLEPLMWAVAINEKRRPLTSSLLRLYIPEWRAEGGRLPRVGLEDALRYIYLMLPDPESAGSIRDRNDRTIAYYYTYEGDRGRSETELTALGKYLYEDPRFAGQTILERHTAAEVLGRIAYPLGGVLPMFEMTRKPLINTSAIALQKLINQAHTLMSHNLSEHGFTQEDIINAFIPGKYYNAAGKEITAREAANDPDYRFIPEAVPKGAGTIRTFEGIRSQEASGERITTPQIVRHLPSPVTNFGEAKEIGLESFYGVVKQRHRLMSGDAVATGESRIQASADFVSSLGTTTTPYERAGRWTLTAALRLAAYLSGQAGRYDGLRVVADAKLSASQVSQEMMRLYSDMRAKGDISHSTMLVKSNVVDDPDAELAKLEAEKGTPVDEGDKTDTTDESAQTDATDESADIEVTT